jgi:CheY-like chemotaxis protein
MPKILVVEDNEESRDVLCRRLQRRGYDVLLASDGKQALEIARTELPDVVLMDLNMPEIDGWEATRQIRAAPETSELPVIALSAHALEGDQEQAMAAGCNDFHTKPVNFERLLDQIESIIKSDAE